MEIIQFNIGDKLEPKENLGLCLGYFDGVHLGHRFLINKAKKEGYKVGVFTFDNSPAYILGFLKENHYLTSVFDKAELLRELDVDYFYVMHFDRSTVNVTKDEFIDQFIRQVNPKKLYMGEDYRFGARGEGTPEYLKNYFEVDVSPFYKIDNKKVSSGTIAQLVEKGKVAEVKPLLGRYYSINGIVVSGLHNGSKINFPTANLELEYPYVFPKIGVYMGYAHISDKKYKAIISIGTHPTIMELIKPIIEVHVLDFDGNLYGKDIYVDFVDYLRDEKRFESLDDLVKQLEKDKEKAKKSLQ